MKVTEVHEEVKEYYGSTLENSSDLKTNACFTSGKPPAHILNTLALISDEVLDKYYGCGLTIPDAIEGLRILDLGSGSGRDCFIASYLVGEHGHITGIDMTDQQVEVAKRNIEFHKDAFGHQKSNVEFIHGNIEELDQLGLQEASYDLIISNCVINLATNKQKVLQDAFRLLKTGGELYFSDVYSDRRIPTELQQNPTLWGECLSGALYWNDFLTYAKQAGFADPRAVNNHPISIENDAIQQLVGDIEFYSVTYRLMKLDGLETNCEDYGQVVCYKGGIKESPAGFTLDSHHYFPAGKMMPVCGNTYKMLFETRYREHFDFYGNWDKHFGIFEGCGGEMPFSQTSESEAVACC